jgi:putative methionine-R-sulfoxide reductase with GAF domain/GNAT superfamily N-acetyltransferase
MPEEYAEIRRARITDAGEIARLAGELGYPMSSDEMARRLAKLVSNEHHHIAVVASGERLFGWMHVERRFSLEGGDRSELMGLVVDSTARRRGFGRELLAVAENWTLAQGLGALVVRSNVIREQSHPFYESLGYARSKTQHVYTKVVESRVEQRLAELQRLADGAGTRSDKAREAARLIRDLGAYRWTGLCDVSHTEIAVIAWDGPEAPTYPRFPVAKGLNGAAVSSKKAVIVQDVASDSRYLTTIGGTRGEMIQPVIDERGDVIGTIDVESDRVNAFSAKDEQLLAACAERLLWLWRR